MEREAFLRTAMQMIGLVRCALKNEKPDPELIASLELEQLFAVCQNHILTACAAYALEAAGVCDPGFTEAKAKAIRKNILLDTERKKILAAMEQDGIWYMPLKGALLKDWYPRLGMRQMSDNDILFDAAYAERVREIMCAMGYETAHFGEGNDDAYIKPPVMNFEMHRQLFSHATGFQKLYEYYQNTEEKLLADADSKYGRHFSDEDFYLYLIAHEYKHYRHGGTGVRSLVDTYVFLQKFGSSLNWDYIRAELKKLSMTEFEEQNRTLAQHLFDGDVLDAEENERLAYYICSGTYGTVENYVKNRIQDRASGSKAKYILQRIFPPMEWIEKYYPFFYRHKLLIPVLWIVRPISGLIKKRRELAAELRALKKKQK